MKTISIASAKKVNLIKSSKKQWFDLFREIASRSLFSKDEDGMHVSYDLHKDGSLKRLFISDAKGKRMSRSNDLEYLKGQYFLDLNALSATKCFADILKPYEIVSIADVKAELDKESKKANTEIKGYGANYYVEFVRDGYVMIGGISYHLN